MNRSYSKIRHIQESNNNLEKRMLSETKKSTLISHNKSGENEVMTHNNKMMTIKMSDSKIVRNYLENIPREVRFIVIDECEFADFNGIELCGLPDLMFVRIVHTDSNFEQQSYECAKDLGNGMYDMSYKNRKELGFSEPTSSTDIYGKYNYNFK